MSFIRRMKDKKEAFESQMSFINWMKDKRVPTIPGDVLHQGYERQKRDGSPQKCPSSRA